MDNLPSLPVFPTLIGEAWPTIKRPIFSTTIQESQSGLEVRIGNFSYQLNEWEIPFNWLTDEAYKQDYQALYGLLLAMYGAFGTFLYRDPSSNYTKVYTTDPVTGVTTSAPGAVQIGIGDGFTKEFQLVVPVGIGFEAVGDVDTMISLTPSGATIAPNGILVYPTAPGIGVPIRANFSYFFRVRFKDDQNDFENFVANWWATKSIALRQVRS